jgi:hypothetical protein
MEYRSSNALSADVDYLSRDRYGNRIAPSELTEGAKKPCEVCGVVVWYIDQDGNKQQREHDMKAHGFAREERKLPTPIDHTVILGAPK